MCITEICDLYFVLMMLNKFMCQLRCLFFVYPCIDVPLNQINDLWVFLFL